MQIKRFTSSLNDDFKRNNIQILNGLTGNFHFLCINNDLTFQACAMETMPMASVAHICKTPLLLINLLLLLLDRVNFHNVG